MFNNCGMWLLILAGKYMHHYRNFLFKIELTIWEWSSISTFFQNDKNNECSAKIISIYDQTNRDIVENIQIYNGE